MHAQLRAFRLPPAIPRLPVEEIRPAYRLAVVGVLDLHPSGRGRLIPPVRQLRHDAFQIALAYGLEKRGPLRQDVVREQDRRFDDPAEEALALY